jgi:hypothetical protein
VREDATGFVQQLHGLQLCQAEEAERAMGQRWRTLRRSKAVRKLS